MNISTRETVLAWVTMAILLGAATFFLGSSKMQEWKDIKSARGDTEQEVILSEKLVSKRGAWDSRLEAALQHVQAFPPEVRVTPQLLQSIEQIARSNSLRLESLSTEDEKSLGDVFALGIKCTWEGDLEALTRFLYALKSEGGKYKVRSLSVAPTKGGGLKGTFTVDCAYLKTAGDPAASLTVTPVGTP